MGISAGQRRPLESLSLEDIQTYLQQSEWAQPGRAPMPYLPQELRLELARRRPPTARPSSIQEPLGFEGVPPMVPPTVAAPPVAPADEGELPLPPPAAPPFSPAGNPPPAARARSGTAVVTPSAGSGVATPQQSPEQQMPQIPLSPRTPPLQAEPGERMLEFGLALLASRSPYFGQAVGEAGQAMRQGDRTRRQENREQQKADTDQMYREGILRLEAAQQAWRQNPRNPEAVMNLARAQHYLASIDTDRIRANAAATAASEAVRDGIDRGTMYEDPATGNAAFLTRSGRPHVTDTPFEAFGQASRFSRELAAWEQRMGQERRAIRTAISSSARGSTMTPAQIEAAVNDSMRSVMESDPRPTRGGASRGSELNVIERQYVPPSR